MLRVVNPFAILVCVLVALCQAESGDWPAWRGPSGLNIAVGKPAPTQWNETDNIVWKVPVEGRGHSSPILVGELLFLTTADEDTEVQSVLAFSKQTGEQAWKTQVSEGGFPDRIHSKNTHATPTIASNGTALFAVFCHHDQVHLAALGLQGDLLWQKPVGKYQPDRYKFGYAPSPALHDGKVFVAAEFEQGWLGAFSQADGSQLWKKPREETSYSSPIVAQIAGKSQLLLCGGDHVTAYDPESGETIWSVDGTTAATSGTMSWDNGVVYANGGYPDGQTIAVKADGSGEILWTNREKAYEQSLLVYNGYVYHVNDTGIAFCWDAVSGEEMWKRRLGGPISASPLASGDCVYFANERGVVFVVKATPEQFEQVAENRLGDEIFATPIVSQGRMYARYADSSGGSRQEFLVCIGE